jgi:molybdopterin-guanine dinucleotide biosynthesis protein A
VAAQTSEPLVVGVVLAGGLSRRMGQDKGQLVLGDKTLLLQTSALLASTGLQATLISTNQPGQGIVDRYPNSGPVGGMHSVFTYLREGGANVTGVVFVPVDMPEITSEDLAELVYQGKLSARPLCFEESNLPLYLPFNDEIYNYLVQAASGLILRSVGALIEKFNGKKIVSQTSKNFININTPSQWREYIDNKHKMKQET